MVCCVLFVVCCIAVCFIFVMRIVSSLSGVCCMFDDCRLRFVVLVFDVCVCCAECVV